MIKVIVMYKNGTIKYLRFTGLMHALEYKLSLTTKELDEIQSFEVYAE